MTQQLPRSEPSVTVKCKALRLPYSLLSFRLTVITPSLDLGEQLSALASLPQLESVGLHGPLLEEIPALPTTVTRYNPQLVLKRLIVNSTFTVAVAIVVDVTIITIVTINSTNSCHHSCG